MLAIVAQLWIVIKCCANFLETKYAISVIDSQLVCLMWTTLVYAFVLDVKFFMRSK